MKLLSASSIFVCSLFVKSLLAGNTDDITIRTVGAANTLDYQLYYGKSMIRNGL